MGATRRNEKLRLQQLRALRAPWLRTRKLRRAGARPAPAQARRWHAFWKRFLRAPGGLRQQVEGRAARLSRPQGPLAPLTRPLSPPGSPPGSYTYYVTYHVMKKPHGMVMANPRIFPGDRILETGEIMPPLKEDPHKHH
ncbi:LOW QUALITY PROTEIN: NADH dehydrogenase [ubiquinone] 1 beta subcomplex subunit 6 [Manacus vitellinus]|uniref:LOW QUALITY PROTEIN: NADH dehydrogenase [ubiquinone] 1 beta subcomplex subunit 6 n=1 Tax=Manacus vitellinus TaxID=328815 RepID=UPI00115C99CF|nr:LOW QUALITY PROTEIN: NADH dehydrogenase [ubiquinone] 1 beta subcomplex subunit 6 [Manacus vitellinus]